MTSIERHNARFALATAIARCVVNNERHLLMYMKIDDAQNLCKSIIMQCIQPFVASNDVVDVHVSIEQDFSNGYDFTFTADKSGKYRFYSASTKETFAYFEEEGAETWAAYSEGGSTYVFSIEYECEAGKTYHLKTGLSDETQTGTYRVFAVAPIEINT